MKFFYLCLGNCLLSWAALCQNLHTVDSLQKTLTTDISIKLKVDIYNQLSKEYALDSARITHYTTQAISFAKKIGYNAGIADAWHRLACFKLYTKNFAEAAPLLEKVQKISQKYHYKKGLGNAYNGMGAYFRLRGNAPKASQMYQQALDINSQINNKTGIAQSLNNLGIVYSHQGNYAKAISAYQRALRITQQIANKRGTASCCTNLGNIYVYQSNFPKALEMYQQALDMFRQIGKKKGMANCYNSMGVVYKHLGQSSKELEMHQKSLKINQQIKSKEGMAHNHNNLGNFYLKRGNYPKALEMYQQALKINTQTENKRDLIKNYSNIANLYKYRGEHHQALKTYQRALELSTQIGNKREQAHIYNSLGQVYCQLDNNVQAKESLRKSLFISRQIGDTSRVAQVYLEFGQLYLAQQQAEQARRHFKYALKLLQEKGEQDFSATAWVNLGIAYYTQQNYLQAQKHLEQGKQIGENTGRAVVVKTAAQYLAKVYQVTGQTQKALENHILFKQMADSLLNEQNIRQIAQLEEQFRFNEEKNSLRQTQAQQEAIMQARLAKEQIARRFQWRVSILFMVIIAILGLFACSLWRSRKKQRRLNARLQTQKDDILIKNTLLQQNEEEIRTKADIIAQQRDSLASANQTLQARNKMVRTQKQTLEETLHKVKELNRFKEQTTHMIAHDLKNPLQAIIALSENTTLSSDQTTIHQAGQRMMLLIQNMLDTQKMQQTQLSLQLQPLCLEQLCNQAIAHVSWLAEAKGLDIHHHHTQESLAVMADQGLLLRVFINLLHNALSYTSAPGKVTIQYTGTPSHVKIQVIDTGVGIAAENLTHVFAPYQHGTLRKSSTGLGLTFCKMAVEAQKGQIGVESELNKGSTFWLLLPAATPATTPTSLDNQTIVKSFTHKKLALSEEEQALLQPYLRQLRQHSVYQTTQIHKIMEQIEVGQLHRIQAWKTGLEEAIFALNQARYAELIQE